ncbi:hypothetical protein HWQ46_09145 [Shewanella sp. D64]|uniref:hypothetical protein n=1 Tax=unclassified Shewanella TaxID=196818 RepID=UPI0022BA71B7|nr:MULTISPECIES: hypothetical protein [unclassified Shewanella]MEC4725706.1 hypothetical protein [Shewanella sp. D64]MEC4737687.1 hypothetical protein [Shewanella sp. E94]WBJ93494.1 hypothetical protein HWQ47_16340 [Shewanella sp. MTB7]
MKILITLTLLVLSLSGCADRASTQLGSEAIVYQELHHFVIEPKKEAKQADIEAQFERIIVSFGSGFEQTRWTLHYRGSASKSWATIMEKKLLSLGLLPSRIRVEVLDSTGAGVEIRVGQYKINTQTCDRGIYANMSNDIGCFVDSMRLKHVRDPETLAVKER